MRQEFGQTAMRVGVDSAQHVFKVVERIKLILFATGDQTHEDGGGDKQEIARGGRRIEAELERIMPVIKDGGFIPGCDHGVPHDVSWPNFVHYVRLLAQATNWL